MFILPTLSKVCAAGSKYDRVSVGAGLKVKSLKV